MWSEPYFDAGGGDVEMMTFSVPVTKEGRFMGILTADFELKEKSLHQSIALMYSARRLPRRMRLVRGRLLMMRM